MSSAQKDLGAQATRGGERRLVKDLFVGNTYVKGQKVSVTGSIGQDKIFLLANLKKGTVGKKNIFRALRTGTRTDWVGKLKSWEAVSKTPGQTMQKSTLTGSRNTNYISVFDFRGTAHHRWIRELQIPETCMETERESAGGHDTGGRKRSVPGALH